MHWAATAYFASLQYRRYQDKERENCYFHYGFSHKPIAFPTNISISSQLFHEETDFGCAA